MPTQLLIALELNISRKTYTRVSINPGKEEKNTENTREIVEHTGKQLYRCNDKILHDDLATSTLHHD